MAEEAVDPFAIDPQGKNPVRNVQFYYSRSFVVVSIYWSMDHKWYGLTLLDNLTTKGHFCTMLLGCFQLRMAGNSI